MSSGNLFLGYTADDLAGCPYRAFYHPDLAPLPDHVSEALLIGAQAHELFYPVERAAALLDPGYWPVETGFSLSPDGAMQVFVHTRMPGVTPGMWHWWFAWHGDEARRYKLWHPRAHVQAAWSDGRGGLSQYVGRTSRVVEYIGSERLALGIRFVAPHSLGLDEQRLAAAGEVAICARGSLSATPVESGWLIHHIRPVPGGAEMRSRFWLGGHNARLRGVPPALGRLLGRTASWFKPLDSGQAKQLLVHCAQEMNHLAAILPALYARFGPTGDPSPRVESLPKTTLGTDRSIP